MVEIILLKEVIGKSSSLQRRFNMSDKDLLKALGIEDRTITLGLDDEYLQITLEKKIVFLHCDIINDHNYEVRTNYRGF